MNRIEVIIQVGMITAYRIAFIDEVRNEIKESYMVSDINPEEEKIHNTGNEKVVLVAGEFKANSPLAQFYRDRKSRSNEKLVTG